MLNDRRGDLLLLINGMPVIHIELKKTGVPVSQAYNQIQKYSREGIFSGFFSLVQIFVAMEPAEALYFANPGPDGKFNKDYAFHWADFNNEPINDWKSFASSLLSIPFEIDSHITEIDTGKIDADYMNSRFEKFLKVLQSGDELAKEATLAELHRSFTSLSQEDQKIAEIFLHDIQRGDVEIDPNRSFRDYLTDYQAKAKNKEVEAIVKYLGIDAGKLTALMNTNTNEANLNDYGRFDELKATIDKQKAKAYFEALEGEAIPPFKVNIKAANLLHDFVIQGGFEIDEPNESHRDTAEDEQV